MNLQTYTRSVRLPVSAKEIFQWHERPGALQRLIPPWESVRVTHNDGGVQDGARVELVNRMGPFRLRWIAEHHGYESGVNFATRKSPVRSHTGFIRITLRLPMTVRLFWKTLSTTSCPVDSSAGCLPGASFTGRLIACSNTAIAQQSKIWPHTQSTEIRCTSQLRDRTAWWVVP